MNNRNETLNKEAPLPYIHRIKKEEEHEVKFSYEKEVVSVENMVQNPDL